jgi:hypothetical protein
MTNPYFFKMIQRLRAKEEVFLYGNLLEITEKEAEETISFLRIEYQKEYLEYPYSAPEYSAEGALWAAKTVYLASQLLLYRENKGLELETLLPDYPAAPSASSILSIDLCLRFLPNIITQLKLIDTEDILIELLERKLYTWHYSGIVYPLAVDRLDFSSITMDKSVHQLYVNRILKYKKLPLALHPSCKELILANLGNYAKEFWNEFTIEIALHG